jgi:hypothetical protein
MISLWSEKYKDILNNKPLPKNLWLALSKYFCWKIWLAQNRAIFKQKDVPRLVATKAEGLLAKFFKSRKTVNLTHETLDSNEERWIT